MKRFPSPKLWELWAAIGISALLSWVCITLPEGKLKQLDSPYPYDWGKGYFGRFFGEEP